MKVDEAALVGGKLVVNQDLNPVAEVPETEPENAAVTVVESLVRWDHPSPRIQVWPLTQFFPVSFS